MSKEIIMKLYAVRDKNTGKFVNDITNPKHKFWEKKGSCESAINRTKRNKEDLELVELTCIKNSEYKRLKEIEHMYNDLCK